MEPLAKYILAGLLVVAGAALALASQNDVVIAAGVGTIASGATLIGGLWRTVPAAEHAHIITKLADARATVSKITGELTIDKVAAADAAADADIFASTEAETKP